MVKLAVVGATGTVGGEILNVLAERAFPADEVVALGPRQAMGMEVSFGDRELKVRDMDGFDYSQVDIAILTGAAKVSREWAPKIAGAGCAVIDTTDAFRMDGQVPLVVPGVNSDAIELFAKRRIVASPSAAAVQLASVLKPLHDAAGVERAVVATYQPVSGAGKDAMEELWVQTKGIFVNQAPAPSHFPKQIAFNVIPQVDEFLDDGQTREEQKLRVETQKIVDTDIQIAATCVRVPVFVGLGMAVHLELAEHVTAGSARKLLRESPGLMVIDNREEEAFATPVDIVGEWATFVSRIREDTSVEHGLALWIVADNLRKGAALNAVEIAELMLNRGLVK